MDFTSPCPRESRFKAPTPSSVSPSQTAQTLMSGPCNAEMSKACALPGAVWARAVETWTVTHGRDGVRTGIVLGRLADGRRFVARGEDGDEALLEMLSVDQPIGSRVEELATPMGNRVRRPSF